MTQKGTIALIPLLIFLIVAVSLLLLYLFGYLKLPSNLSTISPLKPAEPTVTLQNYYNNPFDKSAQYVNPFSEYKNPFDVIK